MAGRQSAGILLYRLKKEAEFFLVHPGGPFWKGKEAGAWSIPKGEVSADESPLNAARREFKEETGQSIDGSFIPLQPIRLKSGKTVLAWLCEGDMDADNIRSNEIRVEYPYKSGKWILIPEVDKAGWFTLDKAKELVNPAQVALLEEATNLVNDSFTS